MKVLSLLDVVGMREELPDYIMKISRASRPPKVPDAVVFYNAVQVSIILSECKLLDSTSIF